LANGHGDIGGLSQEAWSRMANFLESAAKRGEGACECGKARQSLNKQLAAIHSILKIEGQFGGMWPKARCMEGQTLWDETEREDWRIGGLVDWRIGG
jgi:hypothetical protein